MTILKGQNTFSLNTLYQIEQTQANLFAHNVANFYINAGSVDIYGSDSATQPATLSAMILLSVNINVSGYGNFGSQSNIPRYIAFKQKTGITTEIVGTAINKLFDLGPIAS